MDYFSYQVAPRWYRLYYTWLLAYAGGLAGLYAVTKFVPGLHRWQATFGLDRTALILYGGYILYSLTMYWYVQRRSLPMATLGCSMLMTLILLNGMLHTDTTSASTLYIVPWLLSQLFVGFYGLPLLLGGVLLTSVYVLLHCNFDLTAVSRYDWILLLGALASTDFAYLLWRRRLTNRQTQAVDRLSGMLRSNQQESQILIQSIADGVIVMGNDGKITLMNPSAARMTEWPVNEATGAEATLVVKLAKEDGAPLPDGENPLTLGLSHKEQVTKTVTLTGRDGKKQIVSLVLSPVIVQEGSEATGAVAVIRDISEEYAAEQQRGEFISTASHEMRTPVAAIEGYLALALNEKVSTIDSRARAYLEKAHTSTQHLGKLFQDLLTSSKAEDGRLSNHPSVVEMGTFLQQLTDDLRFAAIKKGLLAEFVVGGSSIIDATNRDAASQHVVKPLYYVNVDPDRMREVITNLFDNACKYTESGKISLGLTGDNEVVQLYIRDTGAGIPADDIPHLFQKFYRVDNSATRTIGGTGLGLFICRKIVELYHGRIWVESELGKGSTFFINLPRLSTQRAQNMQATEATKTPTA